MSVKETTTSAKRWDFVAAAKESLTDPDLKTALIRATGKFDVGRQKLIADLPDSDDVRNRAMQIKDETLGSLDRYLDQFTTNVEKSGGHVHFAADAEQANGIIAEIARERGVEHIVKSKSMVSEETELNDALEEAGFHVVETDFGEFILQVAGDRPSHIVVPVVHRTREHIAKVLNEAFGTDLPSDPATLAKDARKRLRSEFYQADMGITGVNFAIAETGTVVQVTNEGNGRLTTTWPKVHVVLMGMEKVIPTLADLPVFLKLLARSATGQPMTVYTNMITGPAGKREGDGAGELHVVILDNGRSDVLASKYRDTLRCIRCGACLNTCPVYQTVGGHAYGGVYPGPIGSLLTPLYDGLERYQDLPQSSSLCGACLEACPVRIDIPRMLVEMKAQECEQRMTPLAERLAFRAWRMGMEKSALYRIGGRLMRWALMPLSRKGWISGGPPPLSGWTSQRPFPMPAPKRFRDMWKDLPG
jgi:L-lactate dehydrogenase complex protein LldF